MGIAEREVCLFLSLHYKRKSNKMHLYEIVDSKVVKTVEDYQHEYYLPDVTGNSDITDVYGNKVIKRVVDRKSDMPDGLSNICYGDINEETKFLHKKYEGKQLFPSYDLINVGFYDIETEFISPVEEAKAPVNAITLYCSKTKRLYVYGNKNYVQYKGQSPLSIDELRNEDVKVPISEIFYYYYIDERKMLEAFIDTLHREKCFIITGWNITNFDNPYIINRLKNLGSDKSFSRYNEVYKNQRTGIYSISGISDLDYMRLYKRFTFTDQIFIPLDKTCVNELKKGKIKYDSTLSDLHKTDWRKFILYNIVDTMLVVELEQKLKFIETTILMCHESLIPYEKIFSTIADHTGMVLNKLHQSNKVLNNNEVDGNFKKPPGGYCYAKKGRCNYLISLDFKSLYPSIMMRDNVGPETLVLNPPMKTKYEIIHEKGKLVFDENSLVKVKRNEKISEINISELLETDVLIVD